MAIRVLHLGPPEPSASGRWAHSLRNVQRRRLEGFCAEVTPAWALGDQGLELDLSGTDRLYGPGLDGAVKIARLACHHFPFAAGGLAATMLAARLASDLARRLGGGILAVPPPNLASFLAGFPIEFLPTTGGRRLRQLGVRTLGDLQVVSADLLRVVFGPAGPRLSLAAAGIGKVAPRSDYGDGPRRRHTRAGARPEGRGSGARLRSYENRLRPCFVPLNKGVALP